MIVILITYDLNNFNRNAGKETRIKNLVGTL